MPAAGAGVGRRVSRSPPRLPSSLSFTVSPPTATERLDRFLADQLGLSRTQAARLVADKARRRRRASRPAPPGSSPAASASPSGFPTHEPPRTLLPAAIPLTIVFEDEHLAVIDKPAGLVVHPAPGHWDDTLVNALVARGTTLSGGAEGRPGIVHRLDRDTSGLMVVAKTDLAHRRLGAAHRRPAGPPHLRRAGLGSPRREPDGHRGARSPGTRRTGSGWRSRPTGAPPGPTPSWSPGSAWSTCSGWSCTPAGPIRSGSTWSTSDTRWSAIRSTPAAAAGGSPARRGARPSALERATPRQALHAAALAFRHPASGRTTRVPLRMARRSAPGTALRWVAKNWLLALTPLAIFVSSIEMANSPTLHAVIFRIGELICAAPAGIVREILPRLPATRIPGVAGRGRRAGQRPRDPAHRARRSRPPAAAARGRTTRAPSSCSRSRAAGYGLGVGQVLDFLEVPAALGRRTAELPGVDPRLVKAVGVRDDQHFILLDIDALFAPIIGS